MYVIFKFGFEDPNVAMKPSKTIWPTEYLRRHSFVPATDYGESLFHVPYFFYFFLTNGIFIYACFNIFKK